MIENLYSYCFYFPVLLLVSIDLSLVLSSGEVVYSCILLCSYCAYSSYCSCSVYSYHVVEGDILNINYYIKQKVNMIVHLYIYDAL